MNLRRLTRDIGPLSLRAEVSPASLNEERRTVDVVWTTGARVLRGFFDRYYEELSLVPEHVRMGRLLAGAPLLDSHNAIDLRAVIGVVEAARLEKARGVATVRFARDEAGSAVLAKVKDGVLRQVSVGYRVHRMEKVEDGEDTIPVYRAIDWEPYEISMVPLGADSGAAVRSQESELNPCEFIAQETKKMKPIRKPARVRAEEDDSEAEGDDEEKEDGEEPEEDGEGEGKKDEPDDAGGRGIADLRVVREERKRVGAIYRIARTLSLPVSLAEKHVRRGTSEQAFHAIAVRQYGERPSIETGPPGGTYLETGADARDKWLRGAGDWLLLRSAVGDVIIAEAKRKGEPVNLDPGEFRGMTFLDLARQALERSGVRTAGMSKLDLMGKALTQRGGGYQTTGDFPVLLESTMSKVLLSAYGTAPDTWTQFCATGSVSDFRPHYRYRLGSFGRLLVVNEHGEFKNQPIPDGEKESISAVTKGYIIGLTRQALINDDLGAFSQLATQLGRSARRSIEQDVYDLLALNAGLGPTMADGKTLFHADHNNISTGAALSVVAIENDRILMAEQMDPSGNDYLDLRPSILLVPMGLGGTARLINDSQYDIDPVTTNATNRFMVPNTARGLFRTIVDTPRLSGTRRYVFAAPTEAPVLEVVFLDGQQAPYLESQDGWRIDGTEWKVRLDYGMGAIDWRGAVTNAGTA